MISPLLANIYLHSVLDLWAKRWRRREATGDMIIVRYADDVVVGFERAIWLAFTIAEETGTGQAGAPERFRRL